MNKFFIHRSNVIIS